MHDNCHIILIDPGAPTDVVVSLREDGTSVELTWQAPADANGIILEYQVIYFGYKGQLPENNEPTAVSVNYGILQCINILHSLSPPPSYPFSGL